MNNKITSTITQLKSQHRKALIPYITAGDPNPNTTIRLMHTLVEAGADIIELGMPFSDPMAEGPVIQAAHERALKHNVNLLDVFNMVKKFRELDKKTPVVLMGYLNPVENMGYAKFAEHAQQAGVDGILIVDLPLEEAEVFLKELNQRNMHLIFLITPTTTQERLKLICEQSGGYHYYVSVKGITGSSKLNTAEVAERLAQIRQVATLPIAVGFGIHDAQSAAAIAKVADGVVVGTALISAIAATDSPEQAAKQLISSMRVAIDTV